MYLIYYILKGVVIIAFLNFTYNINIKFDYDAKNHFFQFKSFPHNTERQKIISSDMSISPNAVLSYNYDNFNNKYVYGNIAQPHSEFSFCVNGKVQTNNSNYEEISNVNDSNILLFRNQSYYTQLGDKLKEYHNKIYPNDNKCTFDRVLEYMQTLYKDFKYQKDVTNINTTAENAINIKSGVCQDYAHILLSLCRADKIPARYVVGMMIGEGASHAWIEALCDNYWIGFDATNNMLIDENYIKISHGRDFKDCTVNKGIFNGGGSQLQNIIVKVEKY